jgi:hypothetical protein
MNDSINLSFGTGEDSKIYWDNSKARVNWDMNLGDVVMTNGATSVFEFGRTSGIFKGPEVQGDTVRVTTNKLYANNNIPVHYGTSDANGSEILGNGWDTKWKIITSNIQITDNAGVTQHTFTSTGSYVMTGYLTVGQESYMGNNVTVTGNVYATAGFETSDKNLKKNIASISPRYEDVFKFKSFNWKDTDKKGYGIIAQDIAEKYPELISSSRDGSLHVNYTGVFAVEISALQDRVKKLEAIIHSML